MSVRIAQVADIEVERLPGNHHLHLEHPREVAEVIGAFLHEQSARRRDGPDAKATGD
jgi:hypothetical protein